MDAAFESSLLPQLVALQPDVQPESVVLNEAGCTLGRAVTCSIVVPRARISRLHAQVEWANGHFQLRDLGSVNGTYVNGQRLHAAHVLVQHDLIGLGDAAALLSFVDPDATLVAAGRLRYDARQMRFFIGQHLIDLTPNQFRLLLYLFQNRGLVCSREQCTEAVWGPDYTPGNDATPLDRLVSTTRMSLRRYQRDARVIETRPGLGYQLADDA